MRTSMYHVTTAPEAAVTMTEQLVLMGEEMNKIFSLLKDIDRNQANLMRHAERLNRLESEIDHLYRQEISRLFSGEEKRPSQRHPLERYPGDAGRSLGQRRNPGKYR